MGGSEIRVGEAPPAFGEAEDKIDEPQRRRPFQQHQETARRQQFADVAQRPAQIARGVEHVGRHHQVVTVGLEALAGRRLFDVEDAEPQEWVSAESLRRPVHEQRRNVGERIVGAFRRQFVQKVRGGSAGAGADFEDPHPPVLRQAFQQRSHQALHHPVRRPRGRRIAVKIRRRHGFPLGEKQPQGITLTPENVGQPLPAPLQQGQFRRRVGILAEQPRCAGGAIAAVSRRGNLPLGIAAPRQDAHFRQDPEQAFEQMATDHAEPPGEGVGGNPLPQGKRPAQSAEGRYDVVHRRILDAFEESAVPCRSWRKRKVPHQARQDGSADLPGIGPIIRAGVRVLGVLGQPLHRVQPIRVGLRGRPLQLFPAGTLEVQPFEHGDQMALGRQQREIDAQALVPCPLDRLDAEPAPAGGAAPAVDTEAVQRHRQVNVGAIVAGGHRAHGLEGPVEEHRVQVVIGHARRQGRRKLDLAQGRPILAPSPLERLESRPEADAARPALPIQGVHVHRLAGVRRDPGRVLRRGGGRWVRPHQPSGGMADPGLLGRILAPAVDLEGEGVHPVRLQHRLHNRLRVLGELERLLESDVFEHRAVRAEDPGRRRHRRFQIARGRQDRLVEDAMILQIHRGIAADARFEAEVGGSRQSEPAAEQRMQAALAGSAEGGAVGPAGRRLRPAAVALERRGGQRHPAAPAALLEAGPIDPYAPDVKGGETFQHGSPIRLSRPQTGPPGQVFALQGLPRQAQQGRLRPELQEHRAALLAGGLHSVGEAHRLPQMATPIAGAGHIRRGRPAIQVGDEADPRRSERNRADLRLESIEDGVHQGRVEGMGNAEAPGFHAGRRELREHRRDRAR